MPFIRIPPEDWGKVWRVLVASGPISRVSQDTVYYVSSDQVKLLKKKRLPYQIVPDSDGHALSTRNGSNRPPV